MSDSLVSIIIPIYKTEKWLPKCIESCIDQTYKNIEVILIDDGSPDNCGKICDKYAEKCKRIRVVHQVNSGVSSARNKGISLANGEFVIFLDSDDWLEKNAVEELMNDVLINNSDLTICGASFYHNERKVSETIHENLHYSNQDNILENLLNRQEIIYYQTPWIKLYRKDIIQKNKLLFDESLKLGEDLTFVLEYIRYISSCSYIDKALFNIQQVTYNKNIHYQTTDIDFHWKTGVTLFKNYIKLYRSTGYYEEYSDRADLFFLRMIKIYINTTIMANAKKDLVLSKVRSFSKNAFCKKLINSDPKLVTDKLERLILLCLKYKMYNALYFAFYFKIRVYNRLYASMISSI